MQHWKFLLYGITGDLSKKMILPSLAQFAELNKEHVTVELIGYSRSKPDLVEIEHLLNSSSKNGIHPLTRISDVQGEYSDDSYLQELIGNLQEHERLIVYLAIPPMLFAPILKNFCLYNSDNINILIEKPIGQNKAEAHEIFKTVEECQLHVNANFIDHYLFKSALQLDTEAEKLLQKYQNKKINKITIQALEEFDVKGRQGYYDQNGAIKDFLPSHFISLLHHVLSKAGKTFANTIYDQFEVQEVQLGQYETYLQDIEKDTSNTETYFKITGILPQNIEVTFESGKNLGSKKTIMLITFEDGSALSWELSPQKALYDASERVELGTDGKKEHVNMFEDVMKRDYSRFFERDMIIAGWELHENVVNFIQAKNIEAKLYKNGIYPLKWV